MIWATVIDAAHNLRIDPRTIRGLIDAEMVPTRIENNRLEVDMIILERQANRIREGKRRPRPPQLDVDAL